MKQLQLSVSAELAVIARPQHAQSHLSEWRTIPFPGRMLAMGLVMHASVENAMSVLQAEKLW